MTNKGQVGEDMFTFLKLLRGWSHGGGNRRGGTRWEGGGGRGGALNS